MAYRTSRRTSRFRRRPSRRYSRRPLRRTFKQARPSCGRRVTLDHRELQGRTTLDLLSYLPGLSGSHGKVFSFFGYLSVANTSGVPARVSFGTSVGPLTSAKPRYRLLPPGGKGTFRITWRYRSRPALWSSTPTGTAIVALNKPLAFLESTANVTWALSVTYQISLDLN